MSPTNNSKVEKRLRYAIYARYSSEMQNEVSLDAQVERCQKEIATRQGVVVGVYTDSAKTGWSLDRPGFNQMRVEAERGKFDAIMFWKFDRLARSNDDAVIIKLLLRHEYGLKLHCVEGFSEDDDDSPYTALMEQMLAVFSAYYSKNLSIETKRGKRFRAMNGEYNGSSTLLGYDLVTRKQATAERPAGLYIHLRQAAIVRRAFRLYATGAFSDRELAAWLMRQPTIQKLRQGHKPLDKEMVREMLQNRTYTGRVRYTDTIYKNGSLGKAGKQRVSKRHRSEWFEGKHVAIITDDLFDQCQAVRQQAARIRHTPAKARTYLLHDRVYCARCLLKKPSDLMDENYGKMRPTYNTHRMIAHYRCLANERGYVSCEQPYALIDSIDDQVVNILSELEIPPDYQARVEQAVRSNIEHAAAFQHLAEIQKTVHRIDLSWEQGFLAQEEYLDKRRRLQQEMAALQPVDYEDLMEAADLIVNFRTYWDACGIMEEPDEARKQLLAKIVDRVVVYDDHVIAITLHGNFSVILDQPATLPQETINRLAAVLGGTNY